MSDALMAVLAQLDLVETEVINAKAWSGGEQAKVHCNFALTAITTARQAIAEATKMVEQTEHNLKDVRCECCGYMTYHREHMGCIRAASQQARWLPIDTAPKDGTVVDIWSKRYGRLTAYVRTDLGDGNVFYEQTEGGYTCIRDATHWIPLPQGPNVVD